MLKAAPAALIAVRMKSRRLSGKALLPLAGRPVLWHLIDRVQRAKSIKKAIICTSTLPMDDPIADFAGEYGFLVYRGHPDNVLSRFIEAAGMYHADPIVRVTGDNPLTDSCLIDEMVALHLREEADYTYTEDTPRGTRPEVISFSAMKRCLAMAEDPDSSEYMTLYFKQNPGVFKQAQYVCVDAGLRRPHYRLTIDTQEDYAVVCGIYDRFYRNNPGFTLKDIIAYLDKHPEILHAERAVPSQRSEGINTRLNLDRAGA